jgi:acetyltransferase-like isoleucine patch superfamily enzyme
MTRIIDKRSLKITYPDAHIRSGTVIYAGSSIGKKFSTGHNAVIRERNKIGKNVMVGVNTYLGPGNTIGDNVRIHTGCFLERVTLGNNVIVAPHVVFTDDPYPPCQKCVDEIGGAVVGENTVIGANVTILPGIRIGKNCLIGAGSVISRNVENNSVMVGNPARKTKRIQDIIHKHKK